MINPDCCFLKIALLSLVYIHKLLGIPVSKRETAALYLHHYPVTFFKCMRYITDFEFHLLNLARNKRFGIFEALPVPAPENFTMYQHLISAHGINLYWLFV